MCKKGLLSHSQNTSVRMKVTNQHFLHPEELCGREFSKSAVSELSKKLDPMVFTWGSRPLEAAYPFVFVDAIVIKVREEGRVRSRGVLIAVEVNT